MFVNLSQMGRISRLTVDGTNNILAAGTTDVNSEIIDMQGYESACFILTLGVISASGSVAAKLQQDSDSAGGTMADIAGTNQGPTADTDDNKTIIIDIHRPLLRYLRLVTTRGDGGNSVIDALHVIRYNATQRPVAQSTTNYGVETFNSPAAGTA